MSLLSIKNLTKFYETKKDEIKALDNISFDVNKNDFISIVGPSGCGKSTLLKILCGLEKKDSGTITSNKNLKYGFMFQSDTLFDYMNVFNNAMLGPRIKKNINNNTNEKCNNLLKKYDLYDFKDKYPNELSGGMRQRVALIRTLMIDPDILLLDEPFSALDYQNRISISNDVYNIIKNENKTTIMVTHDVEEAISLSNIVIVLTNRPATIKNIYKIELEGTPIEKRLNPKFNEYANMIWSDLNVYRKN